MQGNFGRQSFTLAMVFGAMVFGMVLAGGMNWTQTVSAAAEPPSGKAVQVASAGLPSFADLADAVSPAVVSIQAVKIEQASERGSDPFEFFFGPRRRAPRRDDPQERRADSSGSGFVISADGLIVTNHHVIEGATALMVTLDGRQYEAEVRGDDPATDLALIKIEPDETLDHLALSDSDSVRVGDWVMVIGSPLRLDNSVSVGVISAKGRSINITPDSSLENFIQTDAAINFGNSGGPLVDLSGQVVGIATAINFGAENIGFAVPVNILKSILPQLRESGTVRRGYLGVNIEDLDFEKAASFGLDSTDGALVSRVLGDSPSEEAGIKYGDIILGVDGKQVRNNRELIDYIAAQPPDAVVDLEVYRNGERMQKQVTLGERPGTEAVVERQEEEDEGEIEWLGLQYQDLTREMRSLHDIPDEVQGVWVTGVTPTSPLYDKGVRPNDFIVDVNGNPVDSSSELEEAVQAIPSEAYLRLYVARFDPRSGASNSFFVVVQVP